MNGYEVLKVMEEKQWLDSLPVICISAETSEASIGKAYELGATDYFTRPFDTAVVLRRVHNTIALYAKASSSLHDAMEMLSGIFYRIIKINLSTDTYRTLKNISDDFRSPLDGIKSISQRLRQYGEEYVHEEDQEAFLEFCDSENLCKNFSEEDTERISMSYRCRNGQEFRWVSMEIIKSTEYAKDNEVVVLYLRALFPIWKPVLLLAFFYILFSVVFKIRSHRRRSIVTFGCFCVGCLSLVPIHAILLGCVLISCIVIYKHHLMEEKSNESANLIL